MFLALAMLLAGCAAEPRPILRPPPAVRAAEPVIYAARAAPLVIPMSLGAEAEPPVAIEIAFGDRAPEQVPLFWVQIDRVPIPSAGSNAERIAARWLVWRDRWTVAPAWHAARPGARGFLAALVSPPEGEPDSVRINEARHRLVWIPSLDGRTRPLLTAPASDALEAANRILEDDPTQQWRADLYRPVGTTPFVGWRDTGGDPLLEALADQTAARWRFALDTLAAADQDLASRVAANLGGVVTFRGAPGLPGEAGGVALPCRVPDPAEDALLRNLLSPELAGTEKVTAARVWLQARRRTLAWVIDDGSTLDVAGHAAATIGVANVDGAPIAASMESGLGAQLATAAPASVMYLQPVVDGAVPAMEEEVMRSLWGAPAGEASVSAAELARRARLGDEMALRAAGETFIRRVHTTPTPAAPPGASIGPLMTEWTMPQLMVRGGSAAESTPAGYAPTPTPPEDWLTVGMVYREADVGGAEGEFARGQGWVLYLECGAPPSDGAAAAEAGGDAPEAGGDAPEAVRVWFGPFGAPCGILKVARDGVVIDGMPGSAEDGRASRRGVAAMPGVGDDVRLVREADRWVLWLRIPDDCIEDDGLLRIGIERTDGRGERTTWPRPVLPWQREPGRAVIDLTEWGALGM